MTEGSSAEKPEEDNCFNAPQGLARRFVQTLCGHGTTSMPSTHGRQRDTGSCTGAPSILSCRDRCSDVDHSSDDNYGRCAVSELFELLRTEWRNLASLSMAAQERIRQTLDKLQPSDLGINLDEAKRLWHGSGSNAQVGYQEVYSGPDLTLCIFVLARGACIPLHDHPDMHVFGRLLFGQMRVVAYDLNAEEPILKGCRLPRGSKWARQRHEVWFGPEPTTYWLGPETGNVHELHAVEDCAFFDVVVPPYDCAEGRSCTFYALARWPLRDQEHEQPSGHLLVPASAGDFATETLEYAGPRFWPPVEQ